MANLFDTQQFISGLRARGYNPTNEEIDSYIETMNLQRSAPKSYLPYKQQAFEQQQLRRMQAGQGIGQLGLQYGQLGQQDVRDLAALGQSRAAIGQGLGTLGSQAGQLGGQLGALGAQQAQFGALGQQMNLSDANALMQLGGAYRQNQQAQLEAQRMSQREAQMMPYQQLGFLSDIYKGAPSSQYSILTSPTAPGASPFQQIAGLGIAGLGAASGAKYAGLF